MMETIFQTCGSPWLCQKVMPCVVFKHTCYGSILFFALLSTNVKSCINKTSSIAFRDQNQDILVFYSNFVQNQITLHHVIIVLPGTCRKITAVFLFSFL